MDIVGLEAACLQLAADAGLRVPEFRLVPLGAGRRALLVRRFDLSAQAHAAGNANLGRAHSLSLATLLGETKESGAFTYSMVAEAVRKYSIAPRAAGG